MKTRFTELFGVEHPMTPGRDAVGRPRRARLGRRQRGRTRLPDGADASRPSPTSSSASCATPRTSSPGGSPPWSLRTSPR